MRPVGPWGAAGRAGAPLPALCAHTHLFRGARVRVRGLADPVAWAAAPEPVGLELRFSDGETADAELLVGEGGGAVLAVGAYVTAAGTSLGERSWLVGGVRPVGREAEVTLGARME